MSEIDAIVSEARPMDWREKQNLQKKIAYETIAKKTDEILNDMGKYIEYLDIQSRFKDYSPANCMLILNQMPEATYFKSRQNWERDGVSVKRRDKGLFILEPTTPQLNADGIMQVYFNPKLVYDISNTDAMPMKKRVYEPKQLLAALIRSCEVRLQVVDSLDGSNKCAFYKENEETLYVCRNKEISATLQDIVTELSKVEINTKDEHMNTELNDFKAVSIAYMFCKNYNIPFPKEAFATKANKLPEDSKDARRELDKMRVLYEKLVTTTNIFVKDSIKSKENVR